MIKVLFVCLGNICRSPLAEGVFLEALRQADLLKAFQVDSAGTGDWHIGHAPDKRSQAVAQKNGFTLESRARQVHAKDFLDFDFIVAMDKSNYSDLLQLCPKAQQHKILLMRDFDHIEYKGHDVPDPYYGGEDGFAEVHEMLDRSCRNFLKHLQSQI